MKTDDRTPVTPKVIAHWLLMGSHVSAQIVARVKTDESYSVIAEVENERAVRQMLRYAHLGEEVEAVMDGVAAKVVTSDEAIQKIGWLVGKAILDTRPALNEKVRCPEMHQKET
jgi:hypothetical protein